MKKFLNSPWTISIGTTFFGVILTVIIDFIKGKQILSTISFLLLKLWDAIITILCFDLKLWWIIMGIGVILLILFLVSKVKPEKNPLKPDFISYNNDKFSNYKWSWNWEFSTSKKKWHVSNLVPHCPNCDTPMLSDTYEITFQCPRCKFKSLYNEHEKSYEVEAIIIDNLNRKKQSVD